MTSRPGTVEVRAGGRREASGRHKTEMATNLTLGLGGSAVQTGFSSAIAPPNEGSALAGGISVVGGLVAGQEVGAIESLWTARTLVGSCILV